MCVFFVSIFIISYCVFMCSTSFYYCYTAHFRIHLKRFSISCFHFLFLAFITVIPMNIPFFFCIFFGCCFLFIKEYEKSNHDQIKGKSKIKSNQFIVHIIGVHLHRTKTKLNRKLLPSFCRNYGWIKSIIDIFIWIFLQLSNKLCHRTLAISKVFIDCLDGQRCTLTCI